MEQQAHHHQTGDAQDYAVVLERMNRFQEPEARTAIADLRLPAGSRGLDVGCGVGLYTLWLAEAVGPHSQGDGTAIAAPDNNFDWVWCGDVLHHIDTPVLALKEFMRVLRPGGRIMIKESQVIQALFLPGHPELERQLQRAEMQCHHHEAGARSFQERRQRTLETMQAAGLAGVQIRTYVVQRQAPLDAVSQGYIQHVVFARNWGPRLRSFLDAQDWQRRSALCEAHSPQYILKHSDYYCLYPMTLFTARLPA